jgi:hypothetical protein
MIRRASIEIHYEDDDEELMELVLRELHLGAQILMKNFSGGWVVDAYTDDDPADDFTDYDVFGDDE